MRRLMIAGGVGALVALTAFVTLQSDGGSTDVRGRFELAVAKAQEAESGDREIKLSYEVQDASRDGLDGTLTVVRKGGLLLVNMKDRVFSLAVGKDADGEYMCLASADEALGSFFGEPRCEPADADASGTSEEDGSFEDLAAIYGGGFTPAKFLELFDKTEFTVTDAGKKEVAGLQGECFGVESEEEGDGEICFAPAEGILLSLEWKDGEAPARLELKSYSDQVADEDLARPNFVVDQPTLPSLQLTRWVGKTGAKCNLGEVTQPMAIAVSETGEIWIASYDTLLAFDPGSCGIRTVPTGYEGRGNSIQGLVARPNGSIVASLNDGQVIEIFGSGEVRELFEGVRGGNDRGGSVSAPALFPDGSVAIARVEEETAETRVLKLYRLAEGAAPEILKAWEEGFLSGGLLTVPGVGVAFTSPNNRTETHFSASGEAKPTRFSSVLPGLNDCGAYASAEARWEQFDKRTIRQAASGETGQFEVPVPEDDFGCSAAAVSPDGKKLWFVVTYPIPSAAVYEVDLTAPGAPLPPPTPKVDPTAGIPKPALTAQKLFGADTYIHPKDGPCSQAGSYLTQPPKLGPGGALYFQDEKGLRRVSPECEISTVRAKSDSVTVYDFAFDDKGNRYEVFRYRKQVAVGDNIRMIDASGEITLVAGAGCAETAKICGDFPSGNPAGAQIPTDLVGVVALEYRNGALYFADRDPATNPGLRRARRLNGDGTIETLGALPISAEVDAMAVSAEGDVYTSDFKNGVVRIGRDGAVTTLKAGKGNECLAIDSSARVWYRGYEGGAGFEVFHGEKVVSLPAYSMTEHNYCAGLAFLPDGSLVMVESTGDSGVIFWKFDTRPVR